MTIGDRTGDDGATSLLLVLPIELRLIHDRYWIDAQALNGLERWLDNFDRLTLIAPAVRADTAPSDYVPIDLDERRDRIAVTGLPLAYTPLPFLRALPDAIATIDRAIDRHTHLSFALSGLLGSWGAVAAIRAHRRRRAASIWTDRVESVVIRVTADRKRGVRRLYHRVLSAATAWYERYVVRRAELGLFHGADCYAAFAPYSPAPQLVHDIHLTTADRIPAPALATKMRMVVDPERPLSIVYAGRAHPDKGVLDWVEALAMAAAQGVAFEASWYGVGPDLEAARAAVASHGLDAQIAFPGSIDDRAELLRRLRAAHIFAFCHQTPESPRCLVEALVAGVPIVGYQGLYQRDLIAPHGGGLLVEPSPVALAAAIVALAADRQQLAGLIDRAAADGRPFNDRDVFRHRSDLIKALT